MNTDRQHPVNGLPIPPVHNSQIDTNESFLMLQSHRIRHRLPCDDFSDAPFSQRNLHGTKAHELGSTCEPFAPCPLQLVKDYQNLPGLRPVCNHHRRWRKTFPICGTFSSLIQIYGNAVQKHFSLRHDRFSVRCLPLHEGSHRRPHDHGNRHPRGSTDHRDIGNMVLVRGNDRIVSIGATTEFESTVSSGHRFERAGQGWGLARRGSLTNQQTHAGDRCASGIRDTP